MLRLLKITGASLAPFYNEGDFVLVAKIPFVISRLKGGDVIVFRHPYYGTMIKKIERIAPNREHVFVVGESDQSVDSRHIGEIHIADVIGRVIWHIRKPVTGK